METTDFEHFSFPENMQLNVLTDVIKASDLWERLKEFKFGPGISERSLAEFDLGQHCWRSTIKQRDVEYQSPEIPRAGNDSGGNQRLRFSLFERLGFDKFVPNQTRCLHPLYAEFLHLLCQCRNAPNFDYHVY